LTGPVAVARNVREAGMILFDGFLAVLLGSLLLSALAKQYPNAEPSALGASAGRC
jgi:hypothetical protein